MSCVWFCISFERILLGCSWVGAGELYTTTGEPTHRVPVRAGLSAGQPAVRRTAGFEATSATASGTRDHGTRASGEREIYN